MTISFGETFDKVRECFKESSIVSQLVPQLESVTIIRDVNGKIRLFLDLSEEGKKAEEVDTTDLDRCLREKLGSYYGEDIWLPARENDPYKALIETIEAERDCTSWDDGALRWYILERHIAKQAWTNKNVGELPWKQEYVDKGYKPAIASFFSFKGGVGRTTILAATALTLARNGHRVAIVDLDLEAPGLATIFLGDDFNNFGVIDYLLEKKVQPKEWKLSTHLRPINEKTLLGDDGEPLQLLPAGTVDRDYLEKLARLDFQNLVDGELGSRMRELLKELESAAKPLDFILMDARAGFHDIGGLAIANLSHAAVIFGTRSRQSWAGLTPVIRHLASLGGDKYLLLVHSMAPPLTTLGRDEVLREFKEKAYDIFKKNYYSEDEDVPNTQDSDAPFTPLVIPYQESLSGDIALFPLNSTPEESNRLSVLANTMTDTPYREIAEKLCQNFGRQLKKTK